ncbi:SMI1/KNR4 family protein [Paenibacillus sp. FSL P2-0089]|uniref:SMI1/KNR4 family protein n=1 Tax=Paenibacillus sp. FSL P2-0089 TaxID=2954526 RepID=UPI003159ABC1
MNNGKGKTYVVEFMTWAEANGWEIRKKSGAQLHLNSGITSRYKGLPKEYSDFLSVVETCVAPGEQTWFICEAEFNHSAETEFRWNEFEMLSVEAAAGDPAWQSEITAWWDHHLPIVMSVKDGYSFYAIDLTTDSGAIVHGCEPEFEEVEQVADSFGEFLAWMMSDSSR